MSIYDDYYTYDDAEETRAQMTHVHLDKRSSVEKHADWVRLSSDQREIERVKRCLCRTINDYSDAWRNDDTPPANRNRLFYAQRLAAFFETVARIAENSPAVPHSEYKRLLRLQVFYEELAAKLRGEKPYQLYRRSLLCKHGCPDRAVLPDDFTDWAGNEAASMKWTCWPD